MKLFSKRLILLDSHAILHRAYHALPDFSTAAGVPTGALYGLSLMLLRIVEDFKPDYIVAAYDLPKPTYRHEAYKDYKAGRAKTDEALIEQIKSSRKIFDAFNIPIYDKEGFEADDVIGTIVEESKKDKNLEVIIASGDMDTLQLVSGEKVKVFTLKKGIKDTILYNEQAVKDRFGFGPERITDYKGLRGDPSDNIPGIKGIGEKTATIFISNFGSVEDIYKELKKGDEKFFKAGLTERQIELLRSGKEEAEFSKMLATIRPDAPIDFKLPKETFAGNIDFKKIDSLFSELEFRTLAPRLKMILGKEKQVTSGEAGADSLVRFEDSAKTTRLPAPASPSPQEVDKEKFKEARVMLWLLNSNISDPKIEDIFAHTGTKDFDEAYQKLSKEIQEKKLSFVYDEIEKPLIPIVDSMKATGIKIDKDYLEKLSKEYHTELNILEKSIWTMAGQEFNIASPKQLGEILFVKLGLKSRKKTAGGALSTKESELEKLSDEHPIIGEILKYRELAKLLGTYIDAIPKSLDEHLRIHPTSIQTGAVTGRMATKDPSIQNIPNRSELGRKIRAAFIAEKGWKLLAFDYSQIELRIAAFLSKDQKFIDVFKRGEDIHTAVASQVFGVKPESVTKTMRSQAKVINFGVMYGMGVTALQKNLGTDRKAAQKFLTEYFEKFHGLAAYLEVVKKEAAAKGYTETFFGRRRYFEGLKSRIPFIRAAAERMAINAPIQGTEADIVKLAMIRVEKYIKEKKLENKVHLLMQVHDEIVFEAEKGVAEDIVPDIKKIMEDIVNPKDIFGIVIAAEAKIGDNWQDMESIK